MATTHTLTMKLVAKAAYFAGLCQSWDSLGQQQVQSIEAARTATASARLKGSLNQALLTLERPRNGGRQTVVVQHVNAGDGGQAVAAGAVSPRSGTSPGE
ncbi:MAG: hypothetical protein IRY87_16950 [Acetobacteraceae bacterium]|nr:hypothetical protein [Acetobacteraceae bacterium]